MNGRNRYAQRAVRIILLYAFFGGLWIFASDRILELLTSDHRILGALQTAKGWLFVAMSALLLYLLVYRELRARSRTEARLTATEEKYHTLIETANDAILLFDAEAGTVIDANPKAAELLGRPLDRIIGMRQADLHAPTDAERCGAIFREAGPGKGVIAGDICVMHRDGRRIPVEISISAFTLDEREVVLGIFRDITDRHRAEEELRQEKERAQRYLDVAGVIIVVIDADERIRLINRKGAAILGHEEGDITGRNWFDSFVPPAEREAVRAAFRSLMRGAAQPEYFENAVLARSGEERIIAWHNTVLSDEQGSVTGTLSSGEDITLRKRAEAQAQARLERLAALHAIDLIISSSLDLRVTLSEFLGFVVSQLKIDAADVLLLDPLSQTLFFAAQRGFRTGGIERSRLRLGEGIAGKAALEHRSISIPDLLAQDTGFAHVPLLAGEGFIAYYVVPLIAKGQVKGVLEVMHRSTRDLDSEQREFLESLAAQAAIAIDNAALFDDLQRSNVEITLAYDATLEGWARALDLRSRATERHTERVTEMTITLARAMGLSDKDLVHVRRGALLHDIGKIGVPDEILTKAGPLTIEEWKIMRLHPTFAFDMIRPIAYLRPALDIPFSHHEHWDGTGYPRGLKGEQIPLAARIFAVVDTWDALTATDRPYREAEEKEKVREQVRALAGTQLDPKVVEMFLSMEW
jgi:PAS domain S-box-containing protein